MIIIARYLPQFHRIVENDAWWGAGFTEWTTVRQGKPLFTGHCQPKVPLEKTYYDLMDKEVMRWQDELAREYGVDGFSFYHYWFKDGRRILEKPAENLLQWRDIDMPFCFTWANETWARTWSVLTEKNAWVTKDEVAAASENDGVLLRQSYGTEADWVDHIRYLIPFFQDSRYIRCEDKPVFVIYRPRTIYCWPDMLACWEKELHKHGIEGLYVIGETQEDYYVDDKSITARLWRFPDRALAHLTPIVKNGVKTYDYDDYWQMVLQQDWRYKNSENGLYCVAANFDSTPRHGNNGVVLTGDTPAKFEYYFTRLLQKVTAMGSPFVFINAWNEWGEGAYLEPDERNGYGYLQAIKSAKEAVKYVDSRELLQEKIGVVISLPCYDELARYRGNFYAVNSWLTIKEQGKSVGEWLRRQGIYVVAIYGRGYLGQHLVKDLVSSNVEIRYIVEKNVGKRHPQYEVYGVSNNLPPVDAIIVTPVGRYDAIRRDIRRFVDYRTISLEYILAEI